MSSENNVAVLRNAGANVATLLPSIEKAVIDYNKVLITCIDGRLNQAVVDKVAELERQSDTTSEIVIMPHVAGHAKGTGCGAMGLVKSAMLGESPAKEIAPTRLLKPFLGLDASDVEAQNAQVQVDALRSFRAGHGRMDIKVRTEVVALDEKPHEDRVVAVLLDPKFHDYSKLLASLKAGDSKLTLGGVYIVQASSFSEVKDDVVISWNALGIKRVAFMTSSNDQVRSALSHIRSLSELSGGTIEQVPIRTPRKIM